MPITVDPQPHDITVLTRGDDWRCRIPLPGAVWGPGDSVRMQVRTSSAAEDVAMELSTENGRIALVVPGAFDLVVSRADTALIGARRYVYDVEVTQGGIVTTVRHGSIPVRPDVTRGAPPQRLIAATANRFYIVSPAGGTNLVFRVVRNNDGDSSTPPASIGSPFQTWRLNAVGLMANYNGNPAFPDVWLSDDIGSQDYAMLFAGVYGGSYHGGETAASAVVWAGAVAIDPSANHAAPSFSLRNTSTIDWGGGNTATLTGRSLTFNAGGSITETIPITSTLSFSEALLGMLIGSGTGFTEATLNDYGVTVPLAGARVICRSSNDITILNPLTGHWVRCQTDAPSKMGWSRTEFRNGGRSKLYHRFTGVINGVSVTRTLTFGVSAPGSTLALGANLISNGDFAGGLTGWSVQAGSSAAVVSGELRLTRQAAAESRVMQGFATVVGGTYLVVGNFKGDADVGLNYGITSNSNFSTSAPQPPVLQSPYVDGTPLNINAHLFVADQTTHYVMARQATGTAGQVGIFDNFAVYRLL